MKPVLTSCTALAQLARFLLFDCMLTQKLHVVNT